MAGLLLIVSRTKPDTFAYLKLVSEGGDLVILDRRESNRRRIHQRATPERRHGERRRRDVMTDLQKSGWALVCRSKSSSAWSLAERYDAHQHGAAYGARCRKGLLGASCQAFEVTRTDDGGHLGARRTPLRTIGRATKLVSSWCSVPSLWHRFCTFRRSP